MKKIVLLLCVLYQMSSFSQKITEEVFSPKLNENREITISLPNSYLKNTNQKYPLLVLLDGDYLFDPFQGALNYGAYWDDLPEVIIVGVSQNKNDERVADCTTNEISGLPDEKGNKFFEFIGMELVGYLEKKYRIAPFKIIAGHDVTAGFLNFFLYKEKPLFDAYISMSPELPAGMEEHIPNRLNTLEQNIYYYQSTADGDLKKMQDRIKTLDKAVKEIKKPNLNYQFDEFKGASHYSLVLHSIPNALYQFFSVYQPISMAEYNDKIAVLSSGYVDYLSKKYETLEKSLSLKMNIRINDFKAIEAAILKNKAYEEFDKLADLARKNYPKTMLADYELGLMYENMGDNKKAVKAYQAAFQKEEIGDLTKDMMLDKADELKNQ
ncbi:alpha/beta hydrolase [Flavobacterium sp. CYK-55]|uniref:alpha/beta hydrolase-fold protein n=1 Tax=Flavobacterium sp. CYK-55 TaxID=2835529 RepID=UPI001BCCDF71|nr:alpha/beta hydrolase-fold protein [Flavobacterium sp. CYK-55]MBS7787792.1 alpha/beta hydrolase [Flavobacterium sp. CYK-55]